MTEAAFGRDDPDLQRRILDAMPGGVVHVRRDGAVLLANAEAVRLLGLSYDQITARYTRDWEGETLREDGSPCPAAEYPVSRCLATGQAQPPMTIGVRPPGGEIRWAVYTAIPVPDPAGGPPMGAVVTFLDVTGRRRVEEALRSSEETFRQLVLALPDYICLVDRQGRIEFINRGGGVNVAEVVGKSFVDFSVEADRARCAEALARVFRDGQPEDYITHILDGRTYNNHLAPLRGPDGSVDRVLAVCSDLTDQRRSEEERRKLDDRIRDAQRLEGMALLAGGIAHDFGNLLVGVRGCIDLALERTRGTAVEDAVRPLLLDARTAALRSSELTQQLLAYSGRGAIVAGKVDVGDLAEETVQLLKATLVPRTKDPPTIRLEVGRDVPAALADATQVRQVVLNLLTNAVEAGARTIVVRTGRVLAADASDRGSFATGLDKAEYAEVEVEDDGSGMSEATRIKIFDPFFTTKFVGRGLGLAAVLGIVRGHKGGIGVTSAVGVGTRFRVLFPAATHRTPPRLDRPPTPLPCTSPAPEPPAVLVVDDEHHVRKVARLALEGNGLRVLTAESGQQAIELLKADPAGVGLVLLDLLMPDMHGLDACDALRRLRPDLRVVLSSGYGEDAPPERLRGFTGVLRKPWAIEELLETVRKAMAAP